MATTAAEGRHVQDAFNKAEPWDNSEGEGARYIIQGSYEGAVAMPYQDAFMKELSFYLPRDSQPRDLVAVIDLMATGKLAVSDLLSQTAPPEDAPRVYAALTERNTPLLTVTFSWA